jgi:peptide/nickel transport system substrate-binding protein
MENRFGFKDFLLLCVMLAVLGAIVLSMFQYDRQWTQLQAMQSAMDAQTSELAGIRALLAQGIRVQDGGGAGNGTAPASSGATDPFDHIRAAKAKPDYAQGDWFVQAFGAAVGRLTPLVSTDAYQAAIESMVLESLAVRDEYTLQWTPALAQSWTISSDGLTLQFKLRPNACFSDGTPLTADDVVFTYQWIMNPLVAAPRQRAYYEKVASVTAEDAHTVTFQMREPYFMAMEVCGGLAVLSRKFYSQFSESQYNETPGLLFGSGPYKLAVDPTRWQPGPEPIELVRNDRYWGESPGFARFVYREINNDTARLVAFRNGEIDRYGVTPEQYLKLKDDQQLKQTKDLYEFETINGGYRYIAWNQMRGGKPTLFADKRVRQAMTLLADRQDMCKNLMATLATPNSGPFHRMGKQANPQVQPWPFDPQRARDLLKQAGFEDRNGDGVIEDAQGRAFSFKLIYPSSSVNYQQMAFYLKDAYARAGIVLEPDPLEWTIMQQRIDQRDFDAMTLGWTGGIESDPYQIFHSKQISDGGDNYIHYSNPELDRLIDDARRTVDESKRMPLWHQVHSILHEDQPYTFLWTSRAVVFVDKRIRNVQITKTGMSSELEWYVPRALQMRK